MKKFLSILGTGNYAKTKYFWKDKENYIETHFVQEATIKLLCNDFTTSEQIIIFVTEKSYKANWIEQPEGKTYEGLSKLLSNLKPNIKQVYIPDGNNEEELWQIFEIIYNEINENDELHIDITHSFRSLPMLLLVLLNYAKVLKNVTIKSITYGNWEGRDSENYSPIIDLTPLSELQDWTIAANNFVKYGNSRMLVELTNKEIQPILKETKGKNEAANNLRDFSKQIKSFTDEIATVRGKDIFGNDRPSKIKEKLSSVRSSNTIISQLNPILLKIEKKLSIFDEDPVKRLFDAAKWCIEHEMYQQAYSLCFEATITKICLDNNLQINNYKHRCLVDCAVYIIDNEIISKEDEWKNDCKENKEIVMKLINYFLKNKQLIENINKLKDLRNDFMHAGFRQNPTNADNLIKSINEIWQSCVNQFFKSSDNTFADKQ